MAVVGGGIVGAFTSYHLSRRGIKIAWVLGGPTRNSAAWGSGGVMAPGSGSPFPSYEGEEQLQRWKTDEESVVRISPAFASENAEWISQYAKRGSEISRPDVATAWRQMAQEGVREIERLVTGELPCDFSRSGTLQTYVSTRSLGAALEELGATTRKTGIAFKSLTGPECRELEPSLSKEIAGGILYTDDRWVDPGALLDKVRESLVSKAKKEGDAVRIYDSFCRRLSTAGGRVQELVLDEGRVEADEYVIATGAASSALLSSAGVDVPVVPAWGHMILFEPTREILGRPVMSGESRIVMAQTANGQVRTSGFVELAPLSYRPPEERFLQLKARASAVVPALEGLRVMDTWSGMRPVTPDGLPILGRSARYRNMIFAMGHGRIGVTLAPGTAAAITALVSGEDGPPAIYSPSRFGL